MNKTDNMKSTIAMCSHDVIRQNGVVVGNGYVTTKSHLDLCIDTLCRQYPEFSVITDIFNVSDMASFNAFRDIDIVAILFKNDTFHVCTNGSQLEALL